MTKQSNITYIVSWTYRFACFSSWQRAENVGRHLNLPRIAFQTPLVISRVRLDELLGELTDRIQVLKNRGKLSKTNNK